MTNTRDGGLADRRILVVEDEYFAMKDICTGLERAGAVIVGPAPSVADALKLVAEASGLAAAVLDINLRGETVYPVADALTASHVPFVFLTGYSDEAVDRRYGGSPHCEKPVDMTAVERALASCLANGEASAGAP